jgi:hypothetical protein
MHKSIVALASLALITGCAGRPKQPAPPPPPSADQVASMREMFRQVNPSARVGVVSAVLTDMPYAMVADISAEGLKPGDIVSFVDASQDTIAHGRFVKAVDDNKIAVEYLPGKRTPMVGDVAVKF